mgnify:CR=1 FL=1
MIFVLFQTSAMNFSCSRIDSSNNEQKLSVSAGLSRNRQKALIHRFIRIPVSNVRQALAQSGSRRLIWQIQLLHCLTNASAYFSSPVSTYACPIVIQK